MGDFSRDPNARLQDSVAKHYVGVRLQQGVPILDLDWNELEGLRKHEIASLFRQFIGDGVPGDNDGFRIDTLDGGGVGTIILGSTVPEVGLSILAIDFAASTAAGALGFAPSPGQSHAERDGVPARLTGNAAGPFQLTDGSTLTVVVNGQDAETATFNTGDFSDISQATATEVVAALNAVLTRASAEIGTGNDFLIRGGDGTLDRAGRLLVGGLELLNETDLAYTAQPLYQNDALATEWSVAPVPPLNEPTTGDRNDLVYIDVWEREVDSTEDNAFVLPEVGVETTVRLKREWAIRVAEDATDLSGITRLPGHAYLALARLDRAVADAQALPGGSITDLRKRQLTLADLVVSPILVKDEFGLDKVNSGLFASMLSTTSLVYRDLLESDLFLAQNFDDVTVLESVVVLRVLQDVRFLAESGITDATLQRLDNDAALEHLERLYRAQRNFVDTLLPLADHTVSAQRAGTEILLNDFDVWLEGNGANIPGLRPSVIDTPDLGEAYGAQIFINSELGRRAGILPQGLLTIQVVSAPDSTITAGATHQFVYSIQSQLNVDETVNLALSDTAEVFGFDLVSLDEDPSHPGDRSRASLRLTQGATVNVAFNLTVPAAVPIGTASRIVFSATSQLNPAEISFANVEITVTVGDTVALPASDLELNLLFPEINMATDVVPVGQSSTGGHVTFQLEMRYLVAQSITDEFVFSVDFIGAASSFAVLGSTTLNPFNLTGALQGGGAVAAPIPFNIPIEATTTATDGEEGLMLIRLAQTDTTLPEPFFRELYIRIRAQVP